MASVRTAHECDDPADTASKVPSGAFSPLAVLAPQHTKAPSVRTPHECEAPALIESKVIGGSDNAVSAPDD